MDDVQEGRDAIKRNLDEVIKNLWHTFDIATQGLKQATEPFEKRSWIRVIIDTASILDRLIEKQSADEGEAGKLVKLLEEARKIEKRFEKLVAGQHPR